MSLIKQLTPSLTTYFKTLSWFVAGVLGTLPAVWNWILEHVPPKGADWLRASCPDWFGFQLPGLAVIVALIGSLIATIYTLVKVQNDSTQLRDQLKDKHSKKDLREALNGLVIEAENLMKEWTPWGQQPGSGTRTQARGESLEKHLERETDEWISRTRKRLDELCEGWGAIFLQGEPSQDDMKVINNHKHAQYGNLKKRHDCLVELLKQTPL